MRGLGSFLWLVALPFLSGCLSAGWFQDEPVLYRKEITVELEQWREKGEPVTRDYAHPADIPVTVLTGLFRELRHESGVTGSELAPVVVEERVVPLAFSIVEGLRKATPAKRVRFSVWSPDKVFGILPTSHTTRGVAFVHPPGVLNVAFDVVQGILDFDEEDWGDPTKRVVRRTRLVLPETATTYRTPDGEERPQWLTVQVDSRTPSPPTKPPPTPTPAPEPEPEPEPTPPAAKIETKNPPPRPSDQQILDQLRELTRRYQAGEIGEEEYKKERDRLLFGRE